MKKNPHNSNRRPFGTSRLAIGVAAVAGGLALMLTPLGASGQEVTASDTAASVITITQTPSGITLPCVNADTARQDGTLVAYPMSDEATFQLTIHLGADLCTPLDAKAVVYAMPAVGEWPQTLLEAKPFTLDKAGETVITFTKECDRVQFDVITSEASPIIYTGIEQTLLFPLNLETAFQHVGNGPGCAENTTTAAPTTAAPTTAVVLGTTTIADPPTTIKASVLAATTVPAASNSGLAVTGTTSGPFALMGGGLLFIGLAFIMASRRRTA